mmetsp:Transcript_14269/g.43337  ORF Transcript_14269/g.43337 Transcript_14269/m.43337 type:complete len:200 (+) Transcript_14269:2059-2658(+)
MKLATAGRDQPVAPAAAGERHSPPPSPSPRAPATSAAGPAQSKAAETESAPPSKAAATPTQPRKGLLASLGFGTSPKPRASSSGTPPPIEDPKGPKPAAAPGRFSPWTRRPAPSATTTAIEQTAAGARPPSASARLWKPKGAAQQPPIRERRATSGDRDTSYQRDAVPGTTSLEAEQRELERELRERQEEMERRLRISY